MGRFVRFLSEHLSAPIDDFQKVAECVSSGVLTEALIKKAALLVRDDCYDILDLHSEFSELRETITANASLGVSTAACQTLDEIFGECLKMTARVQELALETSVRGYAELDGQGSVLNFNKSLTRLLGVADPAGKSLSTWFGDQADDAEAALKSVITTPDGLHRQLRLTVKRDTGMRDLPVIAEFGSIPGGKEVVAYALLHDISSIVDAEKQAFENSDFGILRVGRSLVIEYCNPEAADIIGRSCDELIGVSIEDIVHPKSLKVLSAEYEKRDKGLASRYPIDIVNNGTTQTVEVTALPEFDLDGKQRVSTLAFIRSIELERVRDKLRDAIESTIEPHQLLSVASDIIGERIPHDKMVFTIYHGNGGWAWPIHIEPIPSPPWPTRWFEISNEVSKDLEKAYEEQGGLIIANLADFIGQFNQSDPLRSDPTMPRLINEGMRSTLTIFIKAENQFVASLTCFSKTEGYFSENDISILRKIGIENLIRFGWRHFERREAEFFDKLSRQIQVLAHRVEPDPSSEQVLQIHKHVAGIITKKLSRFYRWRYVSIFQCDSMSTTTHLLSAFGFHQGHRKEFEGYERGFDEGLIGLAVRRGETVVMDDSGDGSEEANAFIRENEETRAALCHPIKVQGRVVWVLNIEDDRKGAFGVQDKTILTRFIEAMQIVLENLFVEGVLERIINESLDAIMIVEDGGTILRTNSRARDILTSSGDNLRGRSISDFVMKHKDKATVTKAHRLNQFRCVIQGINGGRRHTLLTMRTLPECFGLRVIYLTDLKQLEWKHDIKVIGGVISKAAAEIGAPIAFVDRVVEGFVHDDSKDKAELARRAQNKLSDIRLTYRRVAECFPGPDAGSEEHKLLNLVTIFDDVIQDLSIDRPVKDWIRVITSDTYLPVRVAQDRVEFVFHSLLDYLRRRKADADRITARVKDENGMGIVVLACRIGGRGAVLGDSLTCADKVGRDLVSLGEPGIKRIVESEHNGVFQFKMEEHGETRFVISLPIASEENTPATEITDGI